MPSRNRAREAAKAAAQKSSTGRNKSGKGKSSRRAKPNGNRSANQTGKAQKSASGAPPRSGDASPKRPRTGPMLDPSAADDADVRFVQPYEATKTYVCPGCNRDIQPGIGHMVAVPPEEPDLRRHWHRGCWHNRHTRF